MKKLTKGKGILGMLLVSFMLCALAVPALAETGMSISPDTQTVAAGDPFTVDMMVVTDGLTRAAQFDLSFDPGLVQVDSVTEGSYYSDWATANGGTTYFNSGAIDNNAGTVTGAAVTILGGGSGGQTGSGTFITLHMTAQTGVSGISFLHLFEVIVADENAQPIPGVVVNDGDVVVMLPSQCTLTTSASPSEGGTVTGGGAYDFDTTATVEAIPAGESWHFTGWSGDLSGSENPTTILMDGDKSITGNFAKYSDTLTVTSDGCCDVKVDGVGVTTPYSHDYDCGTEVSLEAVAGEGCEFSGWTVDGIPVSGNPIIVTMNGAHSAKANCTLPGSFTLTTSAIPPEGGTVDLDPAGGTYDEGTPVTLTATPAAGFTFDHWSGDLSGSTNPETLTMNADKNVIAHFIGHPDLTLTRITLPENIYVGEPADVTVNIANTGTNNAGAFEVELYASDLLVDTQTVASLDAGANTDVVFTWTPSEQGEAVSLRVKVDSTGAVDELDETNNDVTGSELATVIKKAAVFFSPADITVEDGVFFTMDLKVAPGTSSIAGVQFDLAFDPAVLQVTGVSEGGLLNQGGANTYFSPGVIENTAGTLTGVAGEITTQGADVSNEAVFSIIAFEAKGVGDNSLLELSNVIVGDKAASPLPLGINGASVTVTSPFVDVTELVYITKPALPASVQVGTTVDFEASGSISGNYLWTFDSGTPATANTRTVSWTAPVSVTTSPTAVSVKVEDPDTTGLEATGTICVLSKVAISDKPTEASIIESGTTSASYTVEGGDSTSYTWELKDSSGAVIDTTTGASYSFTTPSTGAFAGVYIVTVTDNAGFADFFEVKVPIKLTPDSLSFTAKKLDENKSPNSQIFTVFGADGDYTWEILGSKTATDEVDTPADYGTWSGSGTATETFTPADVDAVKKFYARVTVGNDAGLTEENGLNKRVFGPFNLIPVDTFTVTVSDPGGTAIAGATVKVDYTDPNTSTQVAPQVTNEGGKAVFTLPDTGTYFYTVNEAGKVSQEISSKSKEVAVTLEGIGDTITGTVEDTAGTAKGGATVTAYQPSDITIKYQGTTAVDGTYTINLPDGAAQSGWTVVTSLDDFVAVSQADQAVGAVDFTVVTGHGLQAKTTITAVTATVVGSTVQLDITASPAFTDASEVSVTLIDGNGTPGSPTCAGSTISVIYDTVEDFTVVIKADTSEGNDPTTGYYASRAFSYVKDGTATKTEQVDVEAGSLGTGTVSDTSLTQSATVKVPVGGLTKDATIVIKQVPKKTETATSTKASPNYVYEVTATDSATGSELTDDEVKRIEITLPIDLSVVSPSDLEKGVFVIYHADSLATLEAGGGTAVPTSNIISTDYVGDGSIGSVTFYVSSLSVFGIGGSSGGSSSGSSSSGSSSNCFIATAAYGSPFENHVKILRDFRDVYLLPNRIGHAFVDAYYQYSPKIAAFIADHDILRMVVRVALLPMVGMSYLMLRLGTLWSLTAFAALAMLLGLAIVRIRRRLRHSC